MGSAQPWHVRLIDGWLRGRYEPTPLYCAAEHRLMSSLDIVIELADMADLEVNQVAEAMASLGYFVGHDNGRSGWALKPTSTVWPSLPR